MFRGFRGRGRGRHGASRQNLGLVLLALQIFQFGVDRIPLVTLITLITNIGNVNVLTTYVLYIVTLPTYCNNKC